jgi:hypothetical protein
VSLLYLPFALTTSEQTAYDVLFEVYKNSLNTFSEIHSLTALTSICLSAEARPKTIAQLLLLEQPLTIVSASLEDKKCLEEYFSHVGVFLHDLCAPISAKQRTKVYAGMSNSESVTCIVDISQLPLNPPFTHRMNYVLPPTLLTPDLACIPKTCNIFIPLAIPETLPSIDCAYVDRYIAWMKGNHSQLITGLNSKVTHAIITQGFKFPKCPELPSSNLV